MSGFAVNEMLDVILHFGSCVNKILLYNITAMVVMVTFKKALFCYFVLFLVCFRIYCIFKVVGMLCKSNDTNPPKSILIPGCKATK
jgi:hypothetical protein